MFFFCSGASHRSGFLALTTAVILSATLFLFVTVVNFESYFSRFAVLESEAKEISSYLAEACLNTAILRLSQDPTYSVSPAVGDQIKVADTYCYIRSVTPGTFPSRKVIRAQGMSGEAHTNLEVEIDTNTFPDVSIIGWSEKPLF